MTDTARFTIVLTYEHESKIWTAAAGAEEARCFGSGSTQWNAIRRLLTALERQESERAQRQKG